MSPDWKRSYYAIWAAELLAIAGFGTSQPILPFYLQHLGVTEPTALNFWNGLVNSSSSLALAVMAPVWGKLADSYGRRLMLLRAMFGGAVLIFLMGFARSPVELLVLRTLQGAVTGTIGAATVLVAAIVPARQTAFYLGMLQSSIFIGSSLGPLVGGLVADHFSLQINFFATAAMLFTAGLIVMRGVSETFNPERPLRFRLREIVPNFRPLVESRQLFVLLVLLGTVQAANSVVTPILPLFIQQISPAAERVGSITGVILGTSALASAMSAALIGRFAPLLGYGRTISMALIGACLICLPQALVASPMELLALRIPGAVFLGAIGPVGNALIALKVSPEKRGSLFGLSTSFSSFGFAIGPVIGASVAAAAGYRAIFLTTSALLGLNALLTAALLRDAHPSVSEARGAHSPRR